MQGINFNNPTHDLQFIPSSFPNLLIMVEYNRFSRSVNASVIQKSEAESKFNIKLGNEPTFKGIEITDFDGQPVYITPCIDNTNVVNVIKDIRYGNYHATSLTEDMVVQTYGDNVRAMLSDVDGI